MPQGFLAYTRAELVKIGGIGDFHATLPPREVPDDVAHQYESPEAQAAGWVVTWWAPTEDPSSTSPPEDEDTGPKE